jgi:hypothetical protein
MTACSATTAKGRACKRAALPGTEPPLCVSHVGGKVGRKAALTDEVADRIVQLLRAGNYVETAVAAAGVGRATFYEWLGRGDPDGTVGADEPFRAFRERVDHARAEGEARNVALIANAAATSWHAAAWMLERQYPDRWGKPGTQRTGGGAAPQAGDGRPHDQSEDAGEGGTVTPLDALRRRAAAKR